MRKTVTPKSGAKVCYKDFQQRGAFALALAMLSKRKCIRVTASLLRVLAQARAALLMLIDIRAYCRAPMTLTVPDASARPSSPLSLQYKSPTQRPRA